MASCSGVAHLSGVAGGLRGVRAAAAGTSCRGAPTSAVDYGRILGVRPSAPKCEVKAAYRKLALRFHPDVCKGEECEVSFTEVNRAYESLMALDHQSLEGYGEPAYYGFEPAQAAGPAPAQDDDPWSEFLQSLVNGTHEELREDYSSYYSNLRCYTSKAKRSGASQYYQGHW